MFVKVDHEERNEMTSCGVVIFIRESSSWNQSWREFPAAGCANFTRMKEGAERFHEADVYYYRLVDNIFPRERNHSTEKVCKIAEY